MMGENAENLRARQKQRRARKRRKKILINVSDYHARITGRRLALPELSVNGQIPKYLPEEKRIYLRKDTIDDQTVAHEFTHHSQYEERQTKTESTELWFSQYPKSILGEVAEGAAFFIEAGFLNRNRTNNRPVYNIINDMNALVRTHDASETMQSFFSNVKDTYTHIKVFITPYSYQNPSLMRNYRYARAIPTLMFMRNDFNVDRTAQQMFSPPEEVLDRVERAVRDNAERAFHRRPYFDFEKKFEELESKLALGYSKLSSYF